ncbi:MAG: LysM domain-containing protein [Thermoleophilia bacterium]
MGARSFRFWMARVVAPIAFFAAAAFLVLLIRDSFSDDETDGAVEIQVTDGSGETVVVTTTFTVTERAPVEEPPESQPETETAPPRQIPRFYRVRAGDTLESIATRFDVPVATLRELNPRVDPVALQRGARIKLR